MSPTNAGTILEHVDKLWPESLWSDDIRAAFAERLRSLPDSVSVEQVRRAVTENRMTTKYTKTPSTAELCRAIKGLNQPVREKDKVSGQVPVKAWWQTCRDHMQMPRETEAAPALVEYHRRMIQKRTEMGQDQNEVRSSEWAGLVADLIRETGCDWGPAADHATATLGPPQDEYRNHSKRTWGVE